MQKHKYLSVFLAALLLSVPLANRITALQTSAKAAILIDAASGKVLYAENADERLPMASTTKIMTALVALDAGGLDEKVKIPREAVGVEGSSVYLKEGEELTLRELLYAMMLESANDAATAIAIHVGGSIDGFAAMMNEKAKSLGLNNTSFENPHGLDGESHYTTAADLAHLAAYALKSPDFKSLVSTYKTSIPSSTSKRYLLNHNKMLKLYDGAVGVKTGFTKKSGRCLVSAAEREGLTLVAVTLSCPNDWSDHKAMLDYGFENYEMRTLANVGEFDINLECVGSDTSVNVTNITPVCALAKKSDAQASAVIEMPRFVFAPKENGDAVGRVKYYLNGECVGECELVCTNDAPQIKYKKSLFEKVFG